MNVILSLIVKISKNKKPAVKKGKGTGPVECQLPGGRSIVVGIGGEPFTNNPWFITSADGNERMFELLPDGLLRELELIGENDSEPEEEEVEAEDTHKLPKRK
jgi:hypothetical protein